MSALAHEGEPVSLDIHVRGVVQGVGFRPFIHRLAVRHHLRGWVRNESGEVRIHIEGDAEAASSFLRGLERDAPPIARIDTVEVSDALVGPSLGFRIDLSAETGAEALPVSPDVAVCATCLSELRDPSNRRYRYAFITCTDCGPRYTVIERMPYDRARTSMAAFRQCPECRTEYESPSDRRYHSETNSCPSCGPGLWFEASDGRMVSGSDAALAAAAGSLLAGEIVALRGLGGFHLAVDATQRSAVRRLRRRKHREGKPLAIMVPSVDAARRIALVDSHAADLLESPERPIVLLPLLPDSAIAPGVAPGLGRIGVMVAYTPLHVLLLESCARPLVMTSGNLSEEPIAIQNAEARRRLDGVADAFLLHDREIVSRYDDSVVVPSGDVPIVVRRARGYAPLPLPLPRATPRPLLAVGAHLKNTFALAERQRVFPSQHIGDLENIETLDHYSEALARYRSLFQIGPEAVVHDLHPGYLSTRVALDVAEREGLEVLRPVQHHHAHIAAVMGEHGLDEPVVGLAFDGTGYGEDGAVWGAECLLCTLTEFRRLGALRYAPLPGGDRAAREPWRTALGYRSLAPHHAPAFERAFRGIEPRALAAAQRQIETGLNAPQASSMGRLFDAAAAVLGVRRVAEYEAQAPMELEALAGARPASEALPFPLVETEEGWWMDPLPLLVALGESRAKGASLLGLAASFHDAVATTAAELAERACHRHGTRRVALGGGVFLNQRLRDALVTQLLERSLMPLLPLRLGPNDGAISYGQAVVAAARLHEET